MFKNKAFRTVYTPANRRICTMVHLHTAVKINAVDLQESAGLNLENTILNEKKQVAE